MRECLTSPNEGVYNDGQDNEKNYLIVYKDEIIVKSENEKYTVLFSLGTGSYGQVFKVNSQNDTMHALKIVKNKPAYHQHGLSEVKFLEKLARSEHSDLFVRVIDCFVYKNHLCILQELLGKNLYEVLKICKFKGFDHYIVKKIGLQILSGLRALKSMNIVHCDIKPENILISNLDTLEIKIIDFGNACIEGSECSFYIQSRFYRAPEVILGVFYGSGIDIWSFGCIIYELFMGFPLFAGINNEDQLNRIEYMFGEIPTYMREYGVNSTKYNNKENINTNKYINLRQLKEKMHRRDNNFVENEKLFCFLLSILKINPLKRPTVYDCFKFDYLEYNDCKYSTQQESERDRCSEIERIQPNPEPEDINLKRKSVFDINYIHNKIDKDRKYSTFEKENMN
ncbi:dual specificity protein kinase yak1 [Conglomerata obtusa]